MWTCYIVYYCLTILFLFFSFFLLFSLPHCLGYFYSLNIVNTCLYVYYFYLSLSLFRLYVLYQFEYYIYIIFIISILFSCTCTVFHVGCPHFGHGWFDTTILHRYGMAYTHIPCTLSLDYSSAVWCCRFFFFFSSIYIYIFSSLYIICISIVVCIETVSVLSLRSLIFQWKKIRAGRLGFCGMRCVRHFQSHIVMYSHAATIFPLFLSLFSYLCSLWKMLFVQYL